MDRQPPRTTSNEIDLYIRTYYSLLRSTGEVWVRAFEEAHVFSSSSLHTHARDSKPDVAAFAYAAGRLPSCMPVVRRVVLGQSHEQFETAGMQVREWNPTRARGRRRALRFDGHGTLAAFVTSVSDIDDLVPIVTAYQLEWNKMHQLLGTGGFEQVLASIASAPELVEAVRDRLEITAEDATLLARAFGDGLREDFLRVARAPLELSMRLLNGSFLEYQRAAQRWWSGIEPAYLAGSGARRAVYFVSSNTHSLSNLLGGYALLHRPRMLEFARRCDPEGLAGILAAAIERGDEAEIANTTYYLLRQFLRDPEHDVRETVAEVQQFDAESGIVTIESPGHIDVSTQIIELAKLRLERIDPRLHVPGLERLRKSDAVVLNIDYPLGMSAYHHLSRVAQGVGELRGVYVMGKAATLNGRVGDTMISTAAYDEHSQNTYLFRNSFVAADVQPFVRSGTVLDNQKALTVRGAFLQNREYMSVFYREGYTVLEMESGPYLSSVYELVHPDRHPKDEIVNLSNLLSFDLGLLHYASDTPYSRRQSLLSKSLSYFGMDSTYGCAIAIMRKILANEIRRC